MDASPRTVLLAGATGLVGRELLAGLLADATVAAVHAVGRREVALQHPKLTRHRVDFEALPALHRVDEAFIALGIKAADPGFVGVLIKGLFAGWLVALMVWLMPAASSAKFFVIIAVTWLIAVAHFSHVIAGSAEGSFAAMHGAMGWDRYLIGFVLPAFLGNSVGGVVFVALLNHAQVKEEI